MKLKNKKTGEIKELRDVMSDMIDNHIVPTLIVIESEWEDYEEPKEYWCITGRGNLHYLQDMTDENDKDHREIGNYFDTREEAEKAVEKLKAVKRLKDKGFRFEYYDYSDRDLHNHIQIKAITNREVEDSMLYKEDLDLLFGGEE